MQKICLSIFIIVLAFVANAQETKHYTDGVTNLVVDQHYAQGVDWESLFSDYHNEMYQRPIGKFRKIVVAPDGSLFMSQKTKHAIYKFSSDGKKIKEIGSHGSGDGQFPMLPYVQGVVDGKYVYTYDYQGRIRLFSLDGAFYENHHINYMPMESQPLKGNKIAFVGHVPWKDGGVKYIISIYDIATRSEKVIWSRMKNRSQLDQHSVVIDCRDEGMVSFTPPFYRSAFHLPMISSTATGNLLVAFPETGRVDIFDPTGKKKSSFKLNIEALKISEDDKKQVYENTMTSGKKFEENLKKIDKYSETEKKRMIEAFYQGAEKFKDPDYYPDYMPYFSEILVDDLDNLWVVKYSETKDKTEFELYTYKTNGEYIGSSILKCDEYKVILDRTHVQFYNGKMIAVVEEKNGGKIPLRLVRFNLE